MAANNQLVRHGQIVTITVNWPDDKRITEDQVIATKRAVMCPGDDRGSLVQRQVVQLAFVIDVEAR